MKVSHVLIKLDEGDHQMHSLLEYLDMSELRKRDLIRQSRIRFLDDEGKLVPISQGLKAIESYLSTKEREINLLHSTLQF